MFKGKIGIQYEKPTTVSARLSYSLKNFPSSAFISKRKYAFADHEEDDDELPSKDSVLPFGVSVDPVAELLLYCSWPEVAENVVVDTQTYTDFDPLMAPVWALRTRFERLPVCYLSECITEYLQQSESNRSLPELLGEGFSVGGTDYLDEGNPFERLTESKISTITSSVLPSLTLTTSSKADHKKTRHDGPLNEEQLMGMLYYMFPDAQVDSPHSYDIPDGDMVFIEIRFGVCARSVLNDFSSIF